MKYNNPDKLLDKILISLVDLPDSWSHSDIPTLFHHLKIGNIQRWKSVGV
jgi:hypothetical protein